MPVNLEVMYNDILAAAGGVENIVSLGCCMTRFRFTVKDEALVKVDALRKVPDVAGYFYSGVQHQLIVGPSTSTKLVAYFNARHSFQPLEQKEDGVEAIQISPEDRARRAKMAVRRKYSGRVSQICARIGNIFLPLIPAYIGCGLLLGISNILSKTLLVNDPNTAALFNVFGSGIFFYLNAVVGYNANKEFGGTPALGVAFAGILNIPALSQITLFGSSLMPGKGGVLAVLLVCWAGSWFEKKLRNRLKGSAEMFFKIYLDHWKRTRNKGFISIPSGNHDLPRVSDYRSEKELKTVFAFLLTMPGVPFIYYGDEIGMRNLKDLPGKEGGYTRTQARTPMQWDDSLNHGFSVADKEKLYLPVDSSPDAPTVKSQQQRSDSLLNCVKKLIALRLSSVALQACGKIELLHCDYPTVYLRSFGRERYLIALQPADHPFEKMVKLAGIKNLTAAYTENMNAEVTHKGIKLNGSGIGFGIWML